MGNSNTSSNDYEDETPLRDTAPYESPAMHNRTYRKLREKERELQTKTEMFEYNESVHQRLVSRKYLHT